MKNSFVLYNEYSEQLSLLNMEQRGILFTAIFNYQNNQPLPEMDGMIKMAFSFIKNQLDRDKEKYDETCRKRAEAGRLGGAPKGNSNAKKQANQTKQANAFENNQNQAIQAKQAEYEYVDENEDEVVYEYENERVDEQVNDTDILTYQEVLAIAKEECPAVWRRTSDKVDVRMDRLYIDKLIRMLDELSNSYSYKRLRELFKKASKMYISKPKFDGCDLMWLLNNLDKVEQAVIDEQPKNNDDLPLCTVHQVNGVWKL